MGSKIAYIAVHITDRSLAHSARITDTICGLMRYNHLRTAVIGWQVIIDPDAFYQ